MEDIFIRAYRNDRYHYLINKILDILIYLLNIPRDLRIKIQPYSRFYYTIPHYKFNSQEPGKDQDELFDY